MSLILEALKKSESRRRLGEAPDIGTPFTVKPRRRTPWPLIVILVAVAAGIGWWYARTLPRPTDANTVVALPSPPAAPAAGKSPANAPPRTPVTRAGPTPAAREPASAQGQAKPEGPAPASVAKPPTRAAEGGTLGATAPGGVDAPGLRPINRHYTEPAIPATAPAMAIPSAPAAVATAQPPTSHAPVPPAAAAGPPAKPSNEAGMPPPAQQASVAKAEPEALPAKPADATPAPLQVPQYYELAYGVRKDIPPFNLSMHVFAADPAARFIVVDGERKAEGDAVKEGLALREVRTDGIILEFRGQRFFYPRPGH